MIFREVATAARSVLVDLLETPADALRPTSPPPSPARPGGTMDKPVKHIGFAHTALEAAGSAS
jgi:hypothetical protein